MEGAQIQNEEREKERERVIVCVCERERKMTRIVFTDRLLPCAQKVCERERKDRLVTRTCVREDKGFEGYVFASLSLLKTTDTK